MDEEYFDFSTCRVRRSIPGIRQVESKSPAPIPAAITWNGDVSDAELLSIINTMMLLVDSGTITEKEALILLESVGIDVDAILASV